MKRHTFLSVLGCCAFCIVLLSAQKLPKSNLLLFNTKSGNNELAFEAPRFLTAFNLEGYNNQPYFFSDSELYLTTQSKSDTTQSDILALDVLGGRKTQVTATAQPEYSPTPMPNKTHFSCIRVEADGAQKLWAYPIDRNNGGYGLFEWHNNIGYHCWMDDNQAVLFLVGADDKNHQLVLADNNSRKTQYITSNPGRCIAKTADGDVLYVVKATPETWFLKRYNPQTKSSKIVISTRSGSEDFCLLADGSILMGDGAKVYRYDPNKDMTWNECADLSKYGVKKVSRMTANSQGKIAVVVE